MRRPSHIVAALAAALVLTLVATLTPAGAITGGDADGTQHPSVGVIVFYQPDGRFRCSGTLVTPTVVVTAAHCTFEDIGKVAISFDPEIALSSAQSGNIPRASDDSGPDDAISEVGFEPADLTASPLTWHLGTPLTHPDYSDFTDIRNWNDVGIVVLDEAVEGITPSPLAPEGLLDSVRQPKLNKTDFTVVGYGTRVARADGGPQTPTPMSYPLIRRTTTSPGQKLTDQILQLNGNEHDNRGGGGTCFGDSGGPVFLGGYLVADTSYGYTSNCRYLGGYQRVDIPVVQSWLAEHGVFAGA